MVFDGRGFLMNSFLPCQPTISMMGSPPLTSPDCCETLRWAKVVACDQSVGHQKVTLLDHVDAAQLDQRAATLDLTAEVNLNSLGCCPELALIPE